MTAPLSLSLQQLLPIPLRDRLTLRASDVWQKEITWAEPRQRLFIQAPSGTGKTTLIHILYGLRSDYQGAVLWSKNRIGSMTDAERSQLRRESLSVVFQDMRLFPALTAWENLEIKRVLTNTISAEQQRSWMQALGIEDRADKLAATLSYGEQQRVAIIRALLQPFQWLLMDEPFSHLDRANTALAAKLIAEVADRNGASFLFVDLDDNAQFDYTQKLML